MFAFDDLSYISLDELTATQNWQSQYRLITQWGKLIHHKPELRSDENLLRGCETLAWLAHIQMEGGHRFVFDSDSRVLNGLAAFLLAQVDNKTTHEIMAVDLHQVLSDVGLEKHLTPSRNNGLHSIIARIPQLVGI